MNELNNESPSTWAFFLCFQTRAQFMCMYTACLSFILLKCMSCTCAGGCFVHIQCILYVYPFVCRHRQRHNMLFIGILGWSHYVFVRCEQKLIKILSRPYASLASLQLRLPLCMSNHITLDFQKSLTLCFSINFTPHTQAHHSIVL